MIFGLIVLTLACTFVHSSFRDEEYYNYDGPYAVGYQTHRYEPIPYFHYHPEPYQPYPVQTYSEYGEAYGKDKITRKKNLKTHKGVLLTKKMQKMWKLSNDEAGIKHIYKRPVYEPSKKKSKKTSKHCKHEKKHKKKHKKKTKYQKLMDKLMG